MSSPSPESKGLLWRFFRECVRPYWGLQVEIGFCLLVGVVLQLADPLLLKFIIDRALGDGDFALLLTLVAVLGGVLLFRVAFRLVTVWLYSYGGLRILFEFRQRVFQHVSHLSPFFFRGERLGDILARLTSDIDILQRAATHSVVNTVQDLLTILGIVLALLWLDPALALAMFVVYPFLAWGLLRINRRLRREGVNARRAISGLYAFLEERLSAMNLIQEFRREKAECKRHVQVSRPWIRSNLQLSVLGGFQQSLADFMASGAFIVVFLIGGYRVLQGSMSIGSLVAFYTLATRLYRPVTGLIDINIDLQVARASLARVYELLDWQPDVKEVAQPITPEDRRGLVQLDKVGLRWEDGSVGLEDVDLTVHPGQVVALVGPSGSGKSTLSGLLPRLRDPTAGHILLDGVDLRQWPLQRLRETVGLVPQETRLFHDTLAANLRLARPRATNEQLREVLWIAGLGDFVINLQDGLETMVGEQGLRLSGGERQRIALARALLKDPLVHILDEATSALDPRTERQVLDRFFQRTHDRTVILIAHRLTSVANADQIYVLDEGRIVEHGTHDELYGQDGLYRTLYDEQARRTRDSREDGELGRAAMAT